MATMQVDVPLDRLGDYAGMAFSLLNLSSECVVKLFTIDTTSYSSKNKGTPPLDTQCPLESEKLSTADCLCRLVIPM
jgi:hypothetical protein